MLPLLKTRFSIHDWIEGSKTSRQCSDRSPSRPVSVSTTGSKGRKRGSFGVLSCPHSVSVSTTGSKGRKQRRLIHLTNASSEFQYPRLDRRVENHGRASACFSFFSVSVSTTGSKGRKPVIHARAPVAPPGFSIHDWIEGSKTGNQSAYTISK